MTWKPYFLSGAEQIDPSKKKESSLKMPHYMMDGLDVSRANLHRAALDNGPIDSSQWNMTWTWEANYSNNKSMAAIETHFSLPKMSSSANATNGSVNVNSIPEVEFANAKCECCGLTEECTEAYIRKVRERFQGRWICGLCAEAVKDEVVRSPDNRIGKEEALNLHMSFCKKFRSPPNPSHHEDELISAMKQLLFRSLDSPTPRKQQPFVRSKSCFSALKH
ncbi:OLC1v1032901C1 [Oldenlandia corymbosa var. corymbosa]|uniref:OLC1v1032901C1 n=1 Tax=Oldenlandia corymbosa var. corymbosa TaxID=529605 RepID=A0AAV1CMC2_OLDCO|nr:OLC1v1032901C1 [Oldenlandia corymbosa var. corymbosa]